MGEPRPAAPSRQDAPPPGAEAARLARWLRADVWPLWLDRGVDWARGGFHEELDPRDLGCAAGFRRLRVLARQVYSFSEAALAGVERARAAAELGVEALRAARGPDGGHPWRFDLDGRPVDPTRDLYDHAFVLLAFAQAARALGVERLRADAMATARFVGDRMRHEAGGFVESLPAALPRRQNPHMHLLEAALAAHAVFGDPLTRGLADDVAGLGLARLFQPREGALPEYFDDGLSPLREAGRFAVEPGHHYEWAWLLDRYAALAGADGGRGAAAALLGFADRHGLAPGTGLVVDGLWSDGGLRQAGHRLWPQAERIRCERRRGRDGAAEAACAALWRMVEGARPGLWHERLDPAGRPVPGPVPASTLYHLTAALAG